MASRKTPSTWIFVLGFALLASVTVFGYLAAKQLASPPPDQIFVQVAEAPSTQAAVKAGTAAPPAALAARIKALGKGFDGKVGIAVRAIDDGWTADFEGDGKFPQQSVSKLWVATTVMDRVDAGDLSLDDSITLTPADLTIFHQPIRKNIGSGSYSASISELLKFAMTQSDNTANDALFRRVGGKAGVESFLTKKDLSGIHMSEGEKALQMQTAGMSWDDRFSYGRIFWQVRETVPFERRAKAISAYITNPADGATPVAIADGLASLKKGELLSASSTAFLLDLMDQSVTGPDRLRGGLAAGWTLAHKTGTGQVLKQLASAYNDAGILTSPAGRHYAVVVMIGATEVSVPDRQALMQGVMQALIACETAGWRKCD
jgi:beta-lactamase class A